MQRSKLLGAGLCLALGLLFGVNQAEAREPLNNLIPHIEQETMTTQHLYDDLREDEGERLFPYMDGQKHWTIGVGHNLDADPTLHAQLAHLQKNGITRDQSRAIFEHDVKTAEIALDLHLPWWRKLDDERQDALLNLCFNLGNCKLLTWHHFLGFMQAGDFESAAHELENTHPWVDQVKDRAKRIANQIRTGKRLRPGS